MTCKTTSRDRRGTSHGTAPEIPQTDPQNQVPQEPSPTVDTSIETAIKQKETETPVLVPAMPPAPATLPSQCVGVPSLVSDVPNVPAIFIYPGIDLSQFAACPYLNATVVIEKSSSGILDLGSGFTDIRGSLIVTDTDLASITASQIEKIGGSIVIQGNRKLAKLSFPKLSNIGDSLQIGGYTVNENGPISSIEIPNLTSLGGDIRLFNLRQAFDLTKFRITTAGGIWIRDLHQQPSIRFDLLKTVDNDIVIQDSAEADSIEFPALESIKGNILLRSKTMPSSQKSQIPLQIGAPKLQHSGGINLGVYRPTMLGFDELQTIRGNFYLLKSIALPELTRGSILDIRVPKLSTIYGTLAASEVDIQQEQVLNLPSLVAVIGNIQIQGSDFPFSVPVLESVAQVVIKSYDSKTKLFCQPDQPKIRSVDSMEFPVKYMLGFRACNVENLKSFSAVGSRSGILLVEAEQMPRLNSLKFGSTVTVAGVKLVFNPNLAILDFAGVTNLQTISANSTLVTIKENPLLPCEAIKALLNKVKNKNDPIINDGICKPEPSLPTAP